MNNARHNVKKSEVIDLLQQEHLRKMTEIADFRQIKDVISLTALHIADYGE
jgi:hypothetical protein